MAGMNEEKDLLQRVANGDTQAFRRVYDHFYLPVFRFAWRFTDQYQAAEDIATESFLKLWEKRKGFEEWNKMKSFLFTTVRNACLNYLRDEKRHAAHQDKLRIMTPDAAYDLAQHPVAERVYDYMEEEIGRLPEKMKSILFLQLRGLNNEEIAVKLGLAEKTVRNLKVQALKMLRIRLLNKELFALFLCTLLVSHHIALPACSLIAKW